MHVKKTCPICQKEVLDHASAITFTLRKHVREKHPDVYKEIQAAEEEIKDMKVKLFTKYPGVKILV